MHVEKVTAADVEAQIKSAHYFTAADGVDMVSNGAVMPPELELMTYCVLVLKGGFAVTATSWAQSAEKFDAQKGRDVAREKAIDQARSLLCYARRLGTAV